MNINPIRPCNYWVLPKNPFNPKSIYLKFNPALPKKNPALRFHEGFHFSLFSRLPITSKLFKASADFWVVHWNIHTLFPVTQALISKLQISNLVLLFSYSKVFFCFPLFSPLPNNLHLLILFDFIFSNFDCLNFFLVI